MDATFYGLRRLLPLVALAIVWEASTTKTWGQDFGERAIFKGKRAATDNIALSPDGKPPIGTRRNTDFGRWEQSGGPLPILDTQLIQLAAQTAFKKQLTDKETKKLIGELSNKSFKVREAATKRLEEIGIAALELLQEAEEKGDQEAKQRAGLLVKNIRAANRLPTRADGMEFKLVIDKKEWLIPKIGETMPIAISLEVTGTRASNPHRLYLDGTAKAFLRTKKGKSLETGGGNVRDIAAPTLSPRIDKGTTYAIKLKAGLVAVRDRFSFTCHDAFTNYWECRGLSAGDYELVVTFDNDKKIHIDSGGSAWVGHVETSIQIKIIKAEERGQRRFLR